MLNNKKIKKKRPPIFSPLRLIIDERHCSYSEKAYAYHYPAASLLSGFITLFLSPLTKIFFVLLC